jgi:hypothetical protein
MLKLTYIGPLLYDQLGIEVKIWLHYIGKAKWDEGLNQINRFT